MSIFVQNMLKFKETEKALYAFVSDSETWVECGKMRRTLSTTKSKFGTVKKYKEINQKDYSKAEFLAFVDKVWITVGDGR